MCAVDEQGIDNCFCFASLHFISTKNQQENGKFTATGAANAGKAFGWRAWLIMSKGDWKWEKELFSQTRAWSSIKICIWCNASARGKSNKTKSQRVRCSFADSLFMNVLTLILGLLRSGVCFGCKEIFMNLTGWNALARTLRNWLNGSRPANQTLRPMLSFPMQCWGLCCLYMLAFLSLFWPSCFFNEAACTNRQL